MTEKKTKYTTGGKRILYIGGANAKDDWMLAIAKKCEKHFNTSSSFVTLNKGSKEYLQKKKVSAEQIVSLWYEDQTQIKTPDRAFIRKAEDHYGFKLWDVWQISAPRKSSRLKLKDNIIFCWAEFVIKETEKSIERFKPDYVLMHGMAGFVAVIAYHVLKKHSIGIMNMLNARIPGRFTIDDNLQDRWPLLVAEYEKIKKRDLTAEEIKKAKDFITSFKEKPFKPDDSAKIKVPLSTKVKKYLLYAKILRHRKQLPDLRQFFWPFLDKIKDWSGIFEKPVPQEKYAYYPLHVDPEASTSIYGKWYVNQLDLIHKIATSLPCDYKLYVKEHILNYSSRPSYFHQEIKKYPNVRLISPHESSINLIKKSSLVLTITGTVGWEAILLQKPLIAFGDIYYNIFSELATVPKIKELPTTIEKMLKKTPDEIETYKFVTAIFNATFPGNAADPGDCDNRSLQPENVALLVSGIEKYIRFSGKTI